MTGKERIWPRPGCSWKLTGITCCGQATLSGPPNLTVGRFIHTYRTATNDYNDTDRKRKKRADERPKLGRESHDVAVTVTVTVTSEHFKSYHSSHPLLRIAQRRTVTTNTNDTVTKESSRRETKVWTRITRCGCDCHSVRTFETLYYS